MDGATRFVGRLARRKTYGLEEADPLASHSGGPAQLAKVLNTFDLTLLGVGSTLGVGIYVLAGSVAYDTAGPAVCLSFLVAAIASAFAAMSYAEFGARVPKAGSAYIYSYVTVGEFIAFVIGWNLILEYLIGTASVARAFSANLDALTNNKMSEWFLEVMPINVDGLSTYADIFCLGITLVLAVLLGFGVRSSAIFTNIFTFVNVTVVLFVIIGGSINANPANWSIPEEDVPAGFGVGGFFPYGIAGVMAGAAKCFFAFVGFDSIASTGEEAKNARKSIPFSINLTLIIVFCAYFGVSTVITLMVPYYEQDPNTPLVSAFEKIEWYVASWTITIGSLFGLAASLLGAMLPLPRIIYAKAKDGLVFRFLAYVSPRFQTPVIATAIAGVFAAILGAIFDLDALVDMMSIGTLLAYTLVSLSVLILRYEEAAEQASSSRSISSEEESTSNDPESQNSKQTRKPTKASSRGAIIATVVYCAFTIGFCAILVVLENSSNSWLYLGLGICAGPMILLILFLVMLPRSDEPLYFKVPGVPVVPCLSVIINTYLMCKLDYNTWIRFGIWMAVGFLMYFGYGMWNSSEEYVSKGKIPPGGVAPLPERPAASKASDHHDAPPLMVPAKNAIPITSLDDDQVKHHPSAIHQESFQQSSMVDNGELMLAVQHAHQDLEDVFEKARSARIIEAEKQSAEKALQDRRNQEEMAQLNELVMQSHQAAQGVFEDRHRNQEMTQLLQAMTQSHEKAQEAFQDRNKGTDDETKKLEMMALASQMETVHNQLEETFEKRPSSLKKKRSFIRTESTQMNAVLQELKAKSGTNVDSEDEDSSRTPSESAAGLSNEDQADERTSNPTNTLMLNELKKAFNEALKTSENDPRITEDYVDNISPSFVQGLSSSSEAFNISAPTEST